MRTAIAAFRMQLILGSRTPNYWIAQLVTVPQTLIFLSVVHAFSRPDLMTNALLAPILITMWNTALWTGGSVVRDDRWYGRLELHAASPARYGVVVGCRVFAVVLLSLLAVPTTLLTAWLTFGLDIQIQHPLILVTVLVVTALAISATGIIFTSMTILNRAAVTFQNSASYPLLLLGGVFVPLALLPDWSHPIGRLVFLSWSSDLIRDSITQPSVSDVPARLLVIIMLGAVGFLIGQRLVVTVLRRIRVSGEISTI